MIKSTSIWIGLAFVVVALLFWLSRSKVAASSTENELASDAQVLDQLKRYGSDLSKPHQLEFFLYFPTEADAQKAAEQIRAKSFEVKVERAAQGESWLCFATKTMLPELKAIQNITIQFNEIAKRFGDNYDGWGSPIVE